MIIRETQLSVKYDNKREREYDHGIVNYDYENRESMMMSMII